MSELPDKETLSLAKLEKLVNSDQLGQVFDKLEVRANRLIQGPTALSFSILFGSLATILGLITGYLASLQFGVPLVFVMLYVAAWTSSGIAFGNIQARGKYAIEMERRGEALASYIRPLMPLLKPDKVSPEIKRIRGEVTGAIETTIHTEMVENSSPGRKALPPAPHKNQNEE